MIAYRLLEDGGFVCGCTETGATIYAYPSSTLASQAKRAKRHDDRERLAGGALQIDLSGWRGYPHIVAIHDARMWTMLAEIAKPSADAQARIDRDWRPSITS